MNQLQSQRTPYPAALKPFVFHGLCTPQEAAMASGEQFMTRCPSCLDESHCGIALVEIPKAGGNTVPGMWRCLKCDETGNVFTFLQLVLQESLRATTEEDYVQLAADRSIDAAILKEHQLAYSYFYPGKWLLPVFNQEGGLSNLYRYDMEQRREGYGQAFMGTPTCRAPLYNLQSLVLPPPGCQLRGPELEKERREWLLFLVEGHWDMLRFDQLLRTQEIRSQCDLLAVPGANTFNPNWLRYLADRDVVMLFDHDPPVEVGTNGRTRQAGWDGMQRIATICSRSLEFKPSRLRALEWKNVA